MRFREFCRYVAEKLIHSERMKKCQSTQKEIEALNLKFKEVRNANQSS